jgi:hypothetical protein
MLSDIPYAQFYSIAAIESPAAPILVGGIKEMDYVADLLNDEQLVLYTGISNEECLLIFNVEWKNLADIVDTARSNMKNEPEEDNNTTNQ